MSKNHDPYCRCFYPALTDPETCTWCYVIRRVRLDEYFKAWEEGFGIGYGEGHEKAKKIYTNDCFECGYAGEWSTWVCQNCKKENPDIVKDLGLDDEKCSTEEAISRWYEDIDIAYWQGYNNALIEKDQFSAEQESAAGTSNPTTTTQKLDTQDYMCPFCVTPWKCNGPHIDEGDMENFLLYVEDKNAENND